MYVIFCDSCQKLIADNENYHTKYYEETPRIVVETTLGKYPMFLSINWEPKLIGNELHFCDACMRKLFLQALIKTVEHYQKKESEI